MTSCTTSTSCRTPSQTHPRSTPPPPEYEARAARKPWEEGHTCTPLDCFRAFFTLEMEDLILEAISCIRTLPLDVGGRRGGREAISGLQRLWTGKSAGRTCGRPWQSLFARAGGGAGLGRRTCRRYRRSLQMRCGCGEESGRGTAPYPSTAAGFRRSGRATFGGIACVVDGTKTRSARGLCGRRRPFARRAGCLCARIASSTGTGANGCRRAGNPATEATARTRASRGHELKKKKKCTFDFSTGRLRRYRKTVA